MLLRAFAIGLLGAFTASLWLRAPTLDAEYIAALTGAHAAAEEPCHAERPAHAAPVQRCALAPDPVNVIDVSVAAATPELVTQLIRLSPVERVTVVGEQRVTDDLSAGVLIGDRVSAIATRAEAASTWHASLMLGVLGAPVVAGGGEYLEVTIEGLRGSRRVLVLFH